MMQGAARTVVGIRRCARLIEEFASQDALAAADGSAHGYEGAMECAGKSVLVEYAVRRLNTEVFGVNKHLMKHAQNELFLVVGHERGTRLACELAGELDDHEYRTVLRSIALLWAAWTAAVATPGTWLPAETLFNSFTDGGVTPASHEPTSASAEEAQHSAPAPWCNGHYEQRRVHLGTRACMLVTTLAAYACLPGRPLPGASFLEDGARESLHLLECDVSSRLRRAVVMEQSPPSRPRHSGAAALGNASLVHQGSMRAHHRAFSSLPPSSYSIEAREHGGEQGRVEGGEEEQQEEEEEEDEQEEEEEDEQANGSEAAFPVYPPVAPYYKTRHFQRIGTHTSVAWDDCMWMMLMQEEALPEAKRETCFVEYEREFVMLKPFLVFAAVFASGLARTGVLYNDEANADFLRSVVQQQEHRQEKQHGPAPRCSSCTHAGEEEKQEEEEEGKEEEVTEATAAETAAPSRRRTRRRL
jgi:hypothetical protein